MTDNMFSEIDVLARFILWEIFEDFINRGQSDMYDEISEDDFDRVIIRMKVLMPGDRLLDEFHEACKALEGRAGVGEVKQEVLEK